MIRLVACSLILASSLAGCSDQPQQVVLEVGRSRCSCRSASLAYAVIRQPRPGATCLVSSGKAAAARAPSVDLDLPKGTVVEVVLFGSCSTSVDGGSSGDGAARNDSGVVTPDARTLPADARASPDATPSCPRLAETTDCCTHLRGCLRDLRRSNPDCAAAKRQCCYAAHIPTGARRYYDGHCGGMAATATGGGQRFATGAAGACRGCLGRVKVGLGTTSSARLELKPSTSCSLFRAPPPCR